MIDLETTGKIIATYAKHGWLLRRVLLSADSRKAMDAADTSPFRDVQITDSLLDAAWFSRPPRDGGVAWELRYLGSTPFALVENADENSDDFEDVLSDVEERLRQAITEKQTA